MFAWECEPAEIFGECSVAGVRVRDVRDGTLSEIACSGVFPFVGVVPNTAMLPLTLLAASGHVRGAGGRRGSAQAVARLLTAVQSVRLLRHASRQPLPAA